MCRANRCTIRSSSDTLNAAYDLGGPAGYPEEAPLSEFQLA